jgi:hypothetical protein
MKLVSMQDKNGSYVVLDSDLVIQELLSINPEVRGIPLVTALNVGLQVIESQVSKENTDAEEPHDEVTKEPSS